MRKSNIISLFVILLVAVGVQAQEIRLPLQPNSSRFAVIGDNGTGDNPEYDVDSGTIRRTVRPQKATSLAK